MHSVGGGAVVLRALSAALASILLVTSTAHATSCTAKDAEAADAVLDHLNSWAQVAVASRKYGHCDDGSIAEGFSEAVARLLVDRWPTLPALAKLAARDPALTQFVLRHVDATLDTNDVEMIGKLARTKCSQATVPLCRELAAAAARILE